MVSINDHIQMMFALMSYVAFPARTNTQHRESGEKYAKLETKSEREEFV